MGLVRAAGSCGWAGGDESTEICEDDSVPLSDEEERVLAEIERQFTVDAPDTASMRRSTKRTGPRSPRAFGRPPVVSLSLLVLSVAVTVGMFPIALPIAVLGFVGVIVASNMLVRELLAPRVGDDTNADGHS